MLSRYRSLEQILWFSNHLSFSPSLSHWLQCGSVGLLRGDGTKKKSLMGVEFFMKPFVANEPLDQSLSPSH